MIFEEIISIHRFKRIALFSAVITIFIVLALTMRLTILSARHFQQAELANQSGQLDEAIEFYTWSIRNYYPGNLYTTRSVQEAIRVIDQYDENSQIDKKKIALFNLQAALSSIRSFYQPYRDQLVIIQQQIDEIP